MAPAMQFVASLGVVILAGTGLLLLPNSTYPGITLSFTDALFTSTSAVCVTGLNAVDFAHTFTPLGEMFTLALIQIGGFGIMTFAYFVAMVAGQGFSLRDRVLLTDLLDEGNLGGRRLLYYHYCGQYAVHRTVRRRPSLFLLGREGHQPDGGAFVVAFPVPLRFRLL